jgi:hypothetical protein
MPIFTIQTLIDRAKAQADMHDDFVSASTWLAWANVEAHYLDAIIDRSGLLYQETEMFISIPQPAGGENVGDSFRAIVAVYELEGGAFGRYRRLRNSNPWLRTRQRGHLEEDPVQDVGPAQEFYISGLGSLTLWPQPSSGVYVVIGIPVRTQFTLVSNTVNYPFGWEELIVLRMARRALMKEESDCRQVERLMEETEQKVRDDCWNRIMGQGASVMNTDDVDYPGRDRRELPMVGDWTFL